MHLCMVRNEEPDMTDILSLKEELRILNTRLLFSNGGDTLDKGERAELVKKAQRLAGAIEGLEAARVKVQNMKHRGER